MFKVLLPRSGLMDLRRSQLKCELECEGMLLSFVSKLVILLLGTWAVFYQKPRTSLPRFDIMRGILSGFLLLFLLSFWLYYIFKFVDKSKTMSFSSVVGFSSSFLDCLLTLQYFGILLLFFRGNLQPQFLIKVKW